MKRRSDTEIKIKCFYTEEDIDICEILEKEILYYIGKEITDICDQSTLFSDN